MKTRLLLIFVCLPAFAQAPPTVTAVTQYVQQAPLVDFVDAGRWLYDGAGPPCTITKIRNDSPANTMVGLNCLHQYWSLEPPGWNFGNPGFGPEGWTTATHTLIEGTVWTQGITNGIQLSLKKPSNGDFQAFNVEADIAGGNTDASGEADTGGLRAAMRDWQMPVETTVVSAVGNVLAVAPVANWKLGVGRPVLNASRDVLTGTATVLSSNGAVGLLQLTGITLPASDECPLLPSGFYTPKPVDNVPTPMTITLHPAAAYKAGEYFTVAGQYRDTARISSASALDASGNQQITLPLLYSHFAGEQYCVGGAAGGRAIALNDYNAGGWWVYDVIGSPAPDQVYVTRQRASGPTWDFRAGTQLGSVTVYHAAVLRDARNPDSGHPDGTKFTVTDSDAVWTAGDTVRIPTHISMGVRMLATEASIINPYARNTGWEAHFSGLSGWSLFGDTWMADRMPGGGDWSRLPDHQFSGDATHPPDTRPRLYPMGGVHFRDITGPGLWFDYAPETAIVNGNIVTGAAVHTGPPAAGSKRTTSCLWDTVDGAGICYDLAGKAIQINAKQMVVGDLAVSGNHLNLHGLDISTSDGVPSGGCTGKQLVFVSGGAMATCSGAAGATWQVK